MRSCVRGGTVSGCPSPFSSKKKKNEELREDESLNVIHPITRGTAKKEKWKLKEGWAEAPRLTFPGESVTLLIVLLVSSIFWLTFFFMGALNSPR